MSHISHTCHTYLTCMSHIAHICLTHLTHMPHMSHICHTHVTHSTHMSHICHTHVTHSTHMSLTYVAKVEKEALLTFFVLFRKSRKPEFPEFPFSSQRLYDFPLPVLYRPLFMANHFTNDRPNGGPRFDGFLSRSPENEKNTKKRVPKMGIFPNPEMSQKWKKCTFPEISEISGIPAFRAFPYVGHCRISGFAGFPQIHAKPQIRACQKWRNGRYPEKSDVPRHFFDMI